MPSLFDEFLWRGLVYDATEGAGELLASGSVTAYAGFDPTAPSLHVGHLLPAFALSRLQRLGHVPIAVVGGGTGMIGDPSGKSQERNLLSADAIEANVTGIRDQLARFLDFDHPTHATRIVNNVDWLGTIDLLTFLREAGKHFTISNLLQKESVNRRLESEAGISYTEFSYVLLQAYDFLQLFDRYGCLLQLGGSDQWGNITAGIDLIRKLRSRKAYGIVLPLITTSSGAKFGKTEAGAVWLDGARTSPFKFFQFWLNTEDRDVVLYLKYFTFLERETIRELEATVRVEPEKRAAQRVLAQQVTALVHGSEQVTRVERGSQLLFHEEITTLPPRDVLAVLADVPSTEIAAADFGADGIGVVDLIARVGLVTSKSEGRRLVLSGGVYVNNRRAADPAGRVTIQDAIGGELVVLRKGGRETHVVRLT